MHQPGLYNTTFLATNSAPPVEGFFQGYCFIGNDFIFGTNGAQHYQALTGKPIPPGQDGCYVTVRRQDNAIVFDVDFAGYTILYYYHDGTTWAVSNSFASLVDFLRSENIPIRPNYVHLAAANGRGMALGQLFSLQTLAQNIQVAPRTHSLAITPNKVELIPRAKTTFDSGSRYAEALSSFLNTWVSRFETLMHAPEIVFTVDLTGGVDSRANFALVQAALTRLGTTAKAPRLRCASSPSNRIDLEVAKVISGHYGLTMNDNRHVKRLELHGDESYQMYRQHSMGVYWPFYRPTQGPTPSNITIGGGGGGIHRKLYEPMIGSADPNVFFENNARRLKRAEFETEFIQDGHRFLSTILQHSEDPLRALLREGRVRYHSGRTPRTEVAFTPLHSYSAEQVQRLAGESRIEKGQFNYDVMHSLEPDLVTMPYDAESKAPTNEVLELLTNAPIPQDAEPGTAWAPTAHLVQSGAAHQPNAFTAYRTAFDKALENPFVRKFWGKSMLRETSDLMNTLGKGKSIGNAANGQPISAILAADLVTPH